MIMDIELTNDEYVIVNKRITMVYTRYQWNTLSIKDKQEFIKNLIGNDNNGKFLQRMRM